MRIAFLLPAPFISGGIFVVCEHVERLRKKGIDAVLVFRNLPANANTDCIREFSLQYISWQEAQTQEFDLVIATWWETAFEMFSLRSLQYAYFVQSDERRFYEDRNDSAPYLAGLSYSLPLPMLTEAKWIQKMLRDEFGQVAEVARNGVNREIFFPSEGSTKPAGKLRVLIEGPGAVSYKRVGLAFDVVAPLSECEVWYISTDGFINPSWSAQRVLSVVPREEMRFVYSSCDVLLKLSTVEGFFGPPLEMMACGGTAVVAKVTGHEEYCRDAENCLLVELDDVDAARKALLRLHHDRGLLAELQRGGLETARAFDWDRPADIVAEFCKGVMALPPLPRHIGLLAQAVYRLHIALKVQRESFVPLLLEKELQNLLSSVVHRFENLGAFYPTRAEFDELSERLYRVESAMEID